MTPPDLIKAAQRVSAMAQGAHPRLVFKHMLREHQSTLSFEQWTWLLVNLVALTTTTPAAVLPARTAPAPTAAPAAHVPCEGVLQ